MAEAKNETDGQTSETKGPSSCRKNLLPYRWMLALRIVFTGMSASFYLLDTILDYVLVWSYYKDKIPDDSSTDAVKESFEERSKRRLIYFYLTLTFVLAPGILVGIIIMRREKYSRKKKLNRIVLLLLGILGLSPLWKDGKTIYNKFRLLKAHSGGQELLTEYLQVKITNDEAASASYRLLEKFTEGALQTVLQVFIMLYEPLIVKGYERKHPFDMIPWIYYFTVLSSLMSLAWAATNDECSAKAKGLLKLDTNVGKAVTACSHFFVICSRVVAVILAITCPARMEHSFATVPALLMGAWLLNLAALYLLTEYKYYDSKLTMILQPFYLIFVDRQHEPLLGIASYHRATSTIYLIEYTALLCVFLFVKPTDTVSSHLLPTDDVWQLKSFLAPYVLFLLGVVFKFVYHAWCNPNTPFESTMEALKYSICLIKFPIEKSLPASERHNFPESTTNITADEETVCSTI